MSIHLSDLPLLSVANRPDVRIQALLTAPATASAAAARLGTVFLYPDPDVVPVISVLVLAQDRYCSSEAAVRDIFCEVVLRSSMGKVLGTESSDFFAQDLERLVNRLRFLSIALLTCGCLFLLEVSLALQHRVTLEEFAYPFFRQLVLGVRNLGGIEFGVQPAGYCELEVGEVELEFVLGQSQEWHVDA